MDDKQGLIMQAMHDSFLDLELSLKDWGDDHLEALRRAIYCLTHAKDFTDACRLIADFRFIYLNWDEYLKAKQDNPGFLESLKDGKQPMELLSDEEAIGTYCLTNALYEDSREINLLTHIEQTMMVPFQRYRDGCCLFKGRDYLLHPSEGEGVIELLDSEGKMLASYDGNGMIEDKGLPYRVINAEDSFFVLNKAYAEGYEKGDRLKPEEIEAVYQWAGFEEDDDLFFIQLSIKDPKDLELFSLMAIAQPLARMGK